MCRSEKYLAFSVASYTEQHAYMVRGGSKRRELDKIRFIVFIKSFTNVVSFLFLLVRFTTIAAEEEGKEGEDLIKHWKLN